MCKLISKQINTGEIRAALHVNETVKSTVLLTIQFTGTNNNNNIPRLFPS